MLDELLKAIRGAGGFAAGSLGRLLGFPGGVTNREAGDSAANGAAIVQQMVALGLRLGAIEGALRSPAAAQSGTAASVSSARDDGGALQAAVSTVRSRTGLLTGLAASPIASAVLRLFGGSGEAEQPALPELVRPPSVRIDAALPTAVQSRFTPAGRDGSGLTRRETETTPVTIQVQAMDSRSFLDHSDEIAAAVRQALLNTHALSDVMGEG
jgi:hypothetical protein